MPQQVPDLCQRDSSPDKAFPFCAAEHPWFPGLMTLLQPDLTGRIAGQKIPPAGQIKLLEEAREIHNEEDEKGEK